MRDPLAGVRERINLGEVESLLWPDTGEGPPVELGETFKLRTCHIEITRLHRVQQGRFWQWRAEFRRIYPEGHVYLLSRSPTKPYTDKPGEALDAQDEPDAGTLDVVDADDRSDAHRAAGEPPEPEAVPPHEISSYTGSVVARARYEHEIEQAKQQLRELPLSERLRRLEDRAANGADLGRVLGAIENRISVGERRIETDRRVA